MDDLEKFRQQHPKPIRDTRCNFSRSRINNDSIAPSPSNIGPDDPRYLELTRRGFNKRFDAKPDYVRLVGSTADVIDAVQDAVRAGLRLAVRSGGHCLEGFVADPAVRVIIDTSPMSSVAYDPEMDAYVIEAGTTLGEVYRRLFLGWGVVLPAGQSPDVGIGGHALGGAFGFLHRQHGLAVDYLYAVEVVVVGEDGTARSVIATRDPSDPNRELWWAHTGCGGGNLGVVTRYWFRSLPKAPDSVVTLKAEWAWKDIDERAFKQLICNYEEWCERNSDETSRYAALFSVFTAGSRQFQGSDRAPSHVDRRRIGRSSARRIPGLSGCRSRRCAHASR